MKMVYVVNVKNKRFVVDNRLSDEETSNDLLKVYPMNKNGYPSLNRVVLKESSDVYLTSSDAEFEANRRNEILKMKFDSKYLRNSIVLKHKAAELCEQLNIVKSKLASDCNLSMKIFYRSILTTSSIFDVLGYLNKKAPVRLNEFLEFSIDGEIFELDNSLDYIQNSRINVDFNMLYSKLKLNNELFASVSGMSASTLRTYSSNSVIERDFRTILYVYWIGKQIDPKLLLSDFILKSERKVK